jgi:hypothetical protein
MATIDDRTIIRKMLQNGGRYHDDPVPHSIYAYSSAHNRNGRTCAVFYSCKHIDIHESPFVIDPVLLLSEASGITDAGRKFLNGVAV